MNLCKNCASYRLIYVGDADYYEVCAKAAQRQRGMIDPVSGEPIKNVMDRLCRTERSTGACGPEGKEFTSFDGAMVTTSYPVLFFWSIKTRRDPRVLEGSVFDA